MKKAFFKPTRMVHRFNFEPGDTYEEKCAKMRARIEELKAKGYGGIVTNIAWGQTYLNDPTEFELMKEKVQICKELGMRLWIYDENGYPSGIAGTKTIEKNPDFEARGLVMVWHVIAPGESLTQSLPHGHEKFMAAISYQIAGETPTDDELLTPYARYQGDPVEFKNDTDTNLLCLAFYSKHLFEGTHAHNNNAGSRRYVDVSNPDAIAEFINNTYRRYTEALGEYYSPAFGDEGENSIVEAIFTDEPSYQGVYINGYQREKIVHPIDEAIPLYPVVNWGKNVANRFASTYGYRLENELTALFLGHSEHFRQVRHDYHQLMSDLNEQAFYAQISDYCAQVGLNFSGHLLLEDQITWHVMFEGNLFNLLRHMHITGIDNLTSIPDEVWGYAFTFKLGRSVSELYGRGHLMTETSGFNQGNQMDKFTLSDMYVCIMLQLAFGVDIFHSYYIDDDADGVKKKILDAITLATEEIAGKRVSDTLLLYPIETMMRHRKPLYHSIENCFEPIIREQGDNSWTTMRACEDAMLGAQFAMINAQHNFIYIDAKNASRQAEGKWKNFVVGACDVTDQTLLAINHMAAVGTQIIWYAPEGTEMFDGEFAKLPAGTLRVTSEEELVSILCPNGTVLTGDHKGIAMAESDKAILLVNKDNVKKKVCWHGEFTSIVNAYEAADVAIEKDESGVSFTIDESSVYIIKK